MSKLKNKVAVVTGASKGIGADIAKGLAAEGASVVVNYASSKAGADKVVAEIAAKGGKAIAVQGDVSKAADIKRLFAESKKAYGKLDILVNNAGIYKFGALDEITEDDFHSHFQPERSRPDSYHAGSRKAFRPRGRQHHQHRLDDHCAESAVDRCLHRNQGRG